jgi:uncharacterized protein (DUF433 family)
MGVVLDPTVQFGEPCVADTRVTTAKIGEFSSGAGRSELAQMFRLDEASVERALDFERRLAVPTS